MLPRARNGDEVAAGGGRHGHPWQGTRRVGRRASTGTRSYPPRCQPNWAEASVNNRRAALRVFDYDITVPLLDRYEASSSPPRYSAPASGADAATLGPLGMKLK